MGAEQMLPRWSHHHRRLLPLLVCTALLLLTLRALHGSSGASSTSSVVHFQSSDGDLSNIANGTLGFQKIFVVGLASRSDRRDSMALAAAFTGLDIEYIDGATSIDDKAVPPGGLEKGVNLGSRLGWRAHMNVLRTIVERNITSAFVMEDDVDWDIRIKSQMATFANASRLLVQPLKGSDKHLDPTFPTPMQNQTFQNFDVNSDLTTAPTTSPYGNLDRWDLLWLGHCGTRMPWLSDGNVPLGRVVIANDTTVPEYVNQEFGSSELITEYAQHTRVVARARVNTCTLAYGITQAGARRFLYELGVNKMSDTNDMMFRFVCDGVDGRQLATCLTVQPQLFQHHRPAGSTAGYSDINNHSGEYHEKPSTANVRWSVRLNFPVLVDGSTDYIDQYPDAEPTAREALDIPQSPLD